MAKTPQETAADLWKTHGNKLFAAGDFKGAISAYSTSIINNPANPAFFTNRALCHLKLSSWAAAARDARKAVELDFKSAKGHWYLGWALSEGLWARVEREEAARKRRIETERLREGMEGLGFDRDFAEDDGDDDEVHGSMGEAVDSLTLAYHLGLEQSATFLDEVLKALRKARRRRWQLHDLRTSRAENDTEALMFRLLDEHRTKEVERIRNEWQASNEPNEDDLRASLSHLHMELDGHMATLHNTFHNSSQSREPGRSMDSSVVPDCFLGKIHFGLMVDPVITPSGITYDRAEILDHLRTKDFDPLSRRKLGKDELVPNLALKEAIEGFLEGREWTMDA